MDWHENPLLYENVNTTIQNNIIAHVLDAGINLWAAMGARVVHNTLWQVVTV